MITAKQFSCLSSVLTLLAMAVPIQVAKADVITFSGLHAGNDAPFTAYTEGKFTVTPLTSNWYEDDTIYGNPAPSIYDGPIGGAGLATVQVTDHGDFTWQRLDYSSNNGPGTYDVEGLLGGVEQFNEVGGLAAVFGPFGFTTLTSADSTKVIDTLDITFIPVVGIPGPTTINLDNIAATSVPEPGSLPLLTASLAGLTFGLCRRSSKRSKTK